MCHLIARSGIARLFARFIVVRFFEMLWMDSSQEASRLSEIGIILFARISSQEAVHHYQTLREEHRSFFRNLFARISVGPKLACTKGIILFARISSQEAVHHYQTLREEHHSLCKDLFARISLPGSSQEATFSSQESFFLFARISLLAAVYHYKTLRTEHHSLRKSLFM